MGELKGKVWRIGLMGYGSSERNVLLILGALGHVLKHAGWDCDEGAGVAGAGAAYREMAHKPATMR